MNNNTQIVIIFFFFYCINLDLTLASDQLMSELFRRCGTQKSVTIQKTVGIRPYVFKLILCMIRPRK